MVGEEEDAVILRDVKMRIEKNRWKIKAADKAISAQVTRS